MGILTLPSSLTVSGRQGAATYNPSARINVLVIDDNNEPSLGSLVPFSQRLQESDGVNLFIASGVVAEADKAGSVRYLELPHIYTDASLEIWATQIHKQYGLTQIYCKSEDLMLRAAHMREAFGIEQGLTVQQATLFRDKVAMKEAALSGGMPCPPFKRVHSPMCVLSFVSEHGLPLVMKPVFGSASLGVSILRSEQQLMDFLTDGLLKGVSDDGGQLEYTGSTMVEGFEAGEMYHVNGYVRTPPAVEEAVGSAAVQGEPEIVYCWPFQYISTNLDFTQGKSYGNILLSERDPRHAQLLEATQRLLRSLQPLPQHMVFHLELFRLKEPRDGLHFSLCEIAARRPGGSIFGLIDRMEGGHFQELDFRSQLGLPLVHERPADAPGSPSAGIIADIVIRKPVGRLLAIAKEEECPTPASLLQGAEGAEGIRLQYRPIAQPGSLYTGFNSATLNTAAQFIAWGAAGQEQQVQELLLRAQDWFLSTLQVEPLPEEDDGLQLVGSPS